MNTETTNEIQGVYCAACVAQALETGLCAPSDAESLVPYTGTPALCSVCVQRPAEVCDPEEVGR
jgi:hypothetical protein